MDYEFMLIALVLGGKSLQRRGHAAKGNVDDYNRRK
jgi:hypothetical protein